MPKKVEPVYVVAGSDAEAHVQRRFPHKRVRRIGGGLRPATIRGFIDGVPLTFQREQSAGIDAVYHFTFTGSEPAEVTMTIRDKALVVQDGHHGPVTALERGRGAQHDSGMVETQTSPPWGRTITVAVIAAVVAAIAATIVQELIGGESNPGITGGVAGAVSAISIAIHRRKK